MGKLAGKRVVITQKNDFMGPAIERRFSAEGAVVIADERDLTQAGACEALIAEAGHIDILVANLANPAPAHPVEGIDDNAWHNMFDRLVHPLHRLVRAVVPQMIERGRGKIVVIGSATALRGVPQIADYSAARGAQVSYVQAAGQELAPKGININLIAQNWVSNPTYYPPDIEENPRFMAVLKAQVPVGRLATEEEDSALALFLASDDSNFFVGQIIPFAGGWVV